MLAEAGRLAPDPSEAHRIFDDVVTDTIGIDVAKLQRFFSTPPVPTYVATERWLLVHARRLTGDTIEQANNAVRKATSNSTSLALSSDLQAWSTLHRELTTQSDATREPIIPMISSRTRGPAGIDHLPRLWLKGLLKACGALPIGYRSGAVRVVETGLAITPGGLDAQTYERLGVNMGEATGFLDAVRPDYAAFESWFVRNATRLDPETVARHNANCEDTRPAKARVEVAYTRYGGPSRWNYLLDDLIDWQLMHDVLTQTKLPRWTK